MVDTMAAHFKDPLIGAVGPTSNCVMAGQHMTFPHEGDVIESPLSDSA